MKQFYHELQILTHTWQYDEASPPRSAVPQLGSN